MDIEHKRKEELIRAALGKTFNWKVIDEITRQIKDHLVENAFQLDRAFDQFSPDVFDIAFKCRLQAVKNQIGVAVEMSFLPTPRQKYQTEAVCDPRQYDLFVKPSVDPDTGEVLENQEEDQDEN